MGTGWPRPVVAEGNLFVQTAALRQILGAAQPGQSCHPRQKSGGLSICRAGDRGRGRSSKRSAKSRQFWQTWCRILSHSVAFAVQGRNAMVQQSFGSGSYSIIGPYMAEIWPSRLRASGMGLAYGAGNLGKFIGPAGLALIAGSSNLVSPQATADALIPAMNYFAAWYILALVAVLFIGFETRGRTIDEIDSALTAKGPVAEPVKAAAV